MSTSTAGGGEWPARVRAAYAGLLGHDVTVEEGFGPPAVDVPLTQWVDAVTLARDVLECSFFDFLTAVDEEAAGFRVVCHLAGRRGGAVDHLLLRTPVARSGGLVPTVAEVFPGASWHERETHEMFGIEFSSDGEVLELAGLLLPAEFEGHPLRKDFVLASRVAKPWPGEKEPGESDRSVGAGRRRRVRPAGVPADWPSQGGP